MCLWLPAGMTEQAHEKMLIDNKIFATVQFTCRNSKFTLYFEFKIVNIIC